MRMLPRQGVVASVVLVLVVAVVLAIAMIALFVALQKSAPYPGWSSHGITLNTSSWTPEEPGMAALFVGVVRIDASGCVYIGRKGVPGGSDVIWPAGYTAAQQLDGTVTILNPDGVIVAATGHQLRAGGGSPGRDTDFACRAQDGETPFEVQEDLPPLGDYNFPR